MKLQNHEYIQGFEGACQVCGKARRCEIHDQVKNSAFLSPADFKAMGGRIKKRRKYASYQNHLNRKKVIII